MKIKIFASVCACAMAITSLSACKNGDEKDKVKVKEDVGEIINAVSNDVDTGYTWGNVKIGGGGFVPAIIYNPSENGLAYARTDMGGAYKWNTETNSWDCLTDFFGREDANLTGIESIATDSVEPNRVYLACGTYQNSNGAILRSSDYGKTWRKTDLDFSCGGNEPGRGAGERLMIDPNNNSIIYFGSRTHGLYKSTDYGVTFNKVESFPIIGNVVDEGKSVGITWVEFDKSSGSDKKTTQTIFVGVAQNNSDTVYCSKDGGKTWAALENQPQGLYPIHGRVSETGFLYITYANSCGPNNATKGAVYKYNIASGEFTDITPAIHGSCGFSGLSIDAQNQDTIVVSTLNLWSPVDNIFRSTDGGATWQGIWDDAGKNYELDISDSKWLDWHGQVKLGWWIACVAINPFNSDEITYGTGATIYTTENMTKLGTGEKITIKTKIDGLEENAVFDIVSPPTGPALYSIMGDTYGYRHDDVDIAPDQHYNILNAKTIDFAMEDPSIVIRTGTEGTMPIMYSTDSAETWQDIISVPTGLEADSDGGSAAISPDGKTIVWQTGIPGNYPYVTKDFGATWTQSEGITFGVKICSDRVDSNYFYAFKEGTVYVSADGGLNFEKMDYMSPSSAQIEACPDKAGHLWLSGGKAGIFMSEDYGKTITKVNGVQNSEAIGFGKAEVDGGYMAIYMIGEANEEGTGIYRSTDKGLTWKKINDDAHQYASITLNITGDPKVFGRVYFCTNGRGIVMGNVTDN